MNKYILTNVAMFAAGASIASVVTWRILKTKYEQLVQEEIKSVKEALGIDIPKSEENVDCVEPDDNDYVPTETDKEVANTIADRLGYNQYFENTKNEEVDNVERPYIISPDEFNEFDDYGAISLTYYDDGVLTDEDGNIIDDMYDTIGIDPKDHFGEYEEDSVFVRDDARRIDYEILYDSRDYHAADMED